MQYAQKGRRMKMFWSRILFLSVSLLSSANHVSHAASITQATVSTNLQTNTFDFRTVWDSVPDFTNIVGGATPDAFRYFILNPTTAGNCCAPFGGLFNGFPGFAEFNADYEILLPGGTSAVSVMQVTNGIPGPVISTIPITLTGNIVDFAIALTLLNEPNGFVFELEHFAFGSWQPPNSLVGRTDQGPAIIPAVPLPAGLPLFASGLGLLSLLFWRSRKRVPCIRGVVG
jgi:hypothetical protein